MLKSSRFALIVLLIAIVFNIFISYSLCFARQISEAVDPYVQRKTMIFLERGNNYYSQYKFRRALKEYQNAIKIYPDNQDAVFNLANTHVSLGEIDAAIAAYNRVLELAPEDTMTYNNLGNVHEGLKLYKEAENYYLKSLDIDAEFAPALNNLGTLYMEQNRLDEAYDIFQRVVKVEPNKIYGWNNLGNLSYKKEEYDEAVKFYAYALQLDPNRPFLWLNKANAYIKKNKLDFAMQSLEKAYALDRKSPMITETMADVCFMQQDFKQAVRFYKITLSQLKKPLPDVFYKLGKACSHLDKEEAVSYYKKYLTYASEPEIMQAVNKEIAKLEQMMAQEASMKK